MKVIKIDPGRKVFCDICGEDWTNSQKSGGFYGLGTKAVCPDCAPRIEQAAKQHNELHEIRERCPSAISFADWVRNYIRPRKCGL